MGAGISGSGSKRDIPGYSLFLDDELRRNCNFFTSSVQDREDFARVIKEGGWVEVLAKGNLLKCREASPKLREFEVDFTTSSLQIMMVSVGESFASSSGSTRSSRCNSRDVQDNEFEFASGGLYADNEARTCFNKDEMQSILFSVVFPIYLEFKAKRAIRSGPAASDLHASDPSDGNSSCSDYGHLGFQEGQLLSVQDMLISAAAFADEFTLADALGRLEWMNTLIKAIYFCPLHVCICAVDPASGAITPVFINDPSRKRLAVSGKSQRFAAADFLQLWSIVPEGKLLEEVTHSLRSAQPLRFASKPSFARSTRTVLDVTHIFDAAGKHRYVLGVQGDLPATKTAAAFDRYLSDSALLISHLIKTTTPFTAAMFTQAPTSPATPTSHKSFGHFPPNTTSP